MEENMIEFKFDMDIGEDDCGGFETEDEVDESIHRTAFVNNVEIKSLGRVNNYDRTPMLVCWAVDKVAAREFLEELFGIRGSDYVEELDAHIRRKIDQIISEVHTTFWR